MLLTPACHIGRSAIVRVVILHASLTVFPGRCRSQPLTASNKVTCCSEMIRELALARLLPVLDLFLP